MPVCDLCNKTLRDNGKLNRHITQVHEINLVWQICDVENCDFKCKDPYNLNKHKAHVHKIGVKWYPCDQPNCDTEPFKASADLKRHQAAVHGIKVKWHPCNSCNKKFKNAANLNRHIRDVHYIGTVWYQCSECDHQAKSVHDLNKHLAYIHDIGVVWHYCDLCEYRSKTTEGLYTHKQNVHLINVKWHPCGIDNCQYRAKRLPLLKEHQGYRHDIGELECDFCLGMRYKLIPFKRKKVASNICRTCYRKATGRDSRIETRMSNYLDKHFGTEFIIGTDTKLYGDACQKYRPDKIYASPGIVLHIECDEEQHLYTGNDYTCDEKRISDIYDEFPGNKYIIIRWNPDGYKVPKKKPKIEKTVDRLELLLECMGKLIQEPPEEPIKVIYMFYDRDNPLITQNIPHAMVYDEKDIQDL